MPGILIDTYKIKDPNSGLGQFSMQFAKAILAREPEGPFTFLVPRGLEHGLEWLKPRLTDGPLLRLFPYLGQRFQLWHSLYQFSPHRPASGTKRILTVHDLNFLIEKPPAKAVRYLRALQRDVDRSHAVTTISEYTHGELSRHVDLKGKPVTVIHNGIHMPLDPLAPRPASIGERPYFLSIGVIKEKKNIHALLPLMPYFPDHQLVIAGNDRTVFGQELRAHIARLPWRDRILMLGPVEDKVRSALYLHCDGLLFPSTAEGFGMPLVEAMIARKPFFASRSTCLPEIGGDCGYYFDRLETVHMAEVIRHGLKDWHKDRIAAEQRSTERAAQFTWDRCINKYAELYRGMLG